MRRRLAHAFVSLVTVASLSLPAVSVYASPEPGEPPRPPISSGPEKPLPEIKVGREDAIALAVKAFAIPASLGAPNAEVSQGPGSAVWMINWSDPKADRLSIQVGVDGVTGEITSYNRWSAEPATGALSYTRGEALGVARQWLGKLVPRADGSLRLAENLAPAGYYKGQRATYQFRWDRLEQGYRVLGDSISIEIDARTGELASYWRSWQTDRTFAQPMKTLSAKEAEATYRKLLPMRTYYQQFFKPATDKPEWRLIYHPATGFYPLLGHHGGLMSLDGQPIDMGLFEQDQVVPAGAKPYQAPASPLTQEAALKLAQAVAGRTDAPTSVNYREFGKEKVSRYYDFSWYTDGPLGAGQYNTSVSVDAGRGVIASMDNWGNEEPLKEGEEPAISEQEARTKAIAFLQAQRPDLAGKITLTSDSNSLMREKMGWRGTRYLFQVTHLVNGIPLRANQGTVQVDMRTGDVRSLYGGDLPEDLTGLPVPVRMISASDAFDAFFANQGLEQVWVSFWEQPNPKMMERPTLKTDAQLVWMPTADIQLSAIDALSGAPIDWQGQDLRDTARAPVDMQGHWAQREVEMLWYRGVFELKDARFEPGKALTVAEAARWLVLSRGYMPYPGYDFNKAFPAAPAAGERLAASPAAQYFGAAFQYEIIRPEDFGGEVDPGATVSRELFALWAVRAMGYSRIADLPSRLEMSFPDRAEIGARYANAVALLQGLGIVKGDGRGFAPKRVLTRAEAAKITFAVTSEWRR